MYLEYEKLLSHEYKLSNIFNNQCLYCMILLFRMKLLYLFTARDDDLAVAYIAS